jgi:hypothetical protein
LPKKALSMTAETGFPRRSSGENFQTGPALGEIARRIRGRWEAQRKKKRGFQHFCRLGLAVLGGETPIVSVLVGDEADRLSAGSFLFDRGFYVQSVTFPAVPYHAGVLRVQVNANHLIESIEPLGGRLRGLTACCATPWSQCLIRTRGLKCRHGGTEKAKGGPKRLRTVFDLLFALLESGNAAGLDRAEQLSDSGVPVGEGFQRRVDAVIEIHLHRTARVG